MEGIEIRQTLFAPLGSAWGILARAKAAAFRRGLRRARRLPGVVVSVGNLTVGGTGKTPMVIWLAERMIAEGKRVGILTRGYRGKIENGVSDSDEVAIFRNALGTRVLLGVGADRFKRGMKLAEDRVEWFILDDGFQHMQLARDADVVLLDASDPFGGGRCLPAGRLREPISALKRADVVVITRSERAPAVELKVRRHSAAPIFYATTELADVAVVRDGRVMEAVPAGEWKQTKVFAFCGIGNPGAFFADLRDWGFSVVGTADYPDHHRYTQLDATELETRARAHQAGALVCTEKDVLNLTDANFSSTPVFVARIRMKVAEPERLCAALGRAIEINCRGEAR